MMEYRFYKFGFHDTILKSLTVIFLLTFSQVTLSRKTIVLNTGFGNPVSNKSQTGYADQVVGEALRRIGYDLETERLPAERALINANLGIDDGDLIRVEGLQHKYTNLIRVPVSVMTIDMVLFTKNNPEFVVNGWSSIESHSVAIISGWKLMEKNIGKLGSRVHIIKTDSVTQSFTLLSKNRVDFAAYSKWSGLGYLKSHNIKNIYLLSPALASPKVYIYLHKKHKKLVPLLSAALKSMKEDGTTQAIYNRVLKPYLRKKSKLQQ